LSIRLLLRRAAISLMERPNDRAANHASVPDMMFPSVRLLRQAASVIVRQQREIERLRLEVTAAELAYMRIGRDLIEQFLIALDTPENNDEMRRRLTVGLGFYRDEIAVREEQIG